MLSILVTILKTIGIILLVLLVILLALGAAVLWIPFRYKVQASKQEEIKVCVRMSWLMRFVFITIRYENAKLGLIIRVLGIPFYDSSKPKKAKKTKKVSKKKKAKSDSAEVIETKAEKTVTDAKSDSELPKAELEEKSQPDQEESTETPKQKGGMKSRIQQIINTILAIPKKIAAFFEKIKQFFIKTKKTVQKIVRYPGKFKEFLLDEKNKSSIGLIWQTIRRLLRHVRPRRIRGEAVFGFEDPAATGQVLGAASVAYSFLGLKRFRLIPDFEKARLEGWIEVHGRVYAFTVLRIVVKLITDKNIKSLKDRFSQMKEE